MTSHIPRTNMNDQEDGCLKLKSVGIELEVTCTNDSEGNHTEMLPTIARDTENCRVFPNIPLSTRRLQTGFLAAIYFGLGLYRSQEGAAFLDLLIVVRTNIEQGTIIQTSGNLGYMCGCLLSGLVASNVDSNLLCFVLTFLSGLLNIAVPFCKLLYVMAAAMFLRNVFVGTIMSAAIYLCSQLWRSKAGPYLQVLMLLAAIGGFICPLITEPFLARRLDKGQITSNTSNSSLHLHACLFSSPIEYLREPVLNKADVKIPIANVDNDSGRSGVRMPGESQETKSESTFFRAKNGLSNCSRELLDGDSLEKGDRKTKVHWSFLITGLYGILTGLPFLIKYIRKGFRNSKTNKVKQKNSKSRRQFIRCSKTEISCIRFLAYACIGVILFSYGSVEKISHIFTMPFVVRYLNWNKARASQILAGYWAGFALGRLLGIIKARYLSIGKMIVIDLIFIVAGQVALYVGTLGHAIALWVACVALGLGMGSFYGAILSWVSLSIAPLTGKLTAYCTTCFSLGIIVQLSLLGYLFENSTPMWFLYLSVIFTLIVVVAFIAMFPLISLLKRNSSYR